MIPSVAGRSPSRCVRSSSTSAASSNCAESRSSQTSFRAGDASALTIRIRSSSLHRSHGEPDRVTGHTSAELTVTPAQSYRSHQLRVRPLAAAFTALSPAGDSTILSIAVCATVPAAFCPAPVLHRRHDDASVSSIHRSGDSCHSPATAHLRYGELS